MNKFELQPLPYASNALEPVIGQRTIETHHGKHLQAYVNNLNAALETNDNFNGMTVDAIYLRSEGGIRNNAGQIINHNLYFGQFKSPAADNKPSGKIAELIETHFGSFEAFKTEFVKQGTTLFGSGWVWLSLDSDGKPVTSYGKSKVEDFVTYAGKVNLQYVIRGGHRFYANAAYFKDAPNFNQIFVSPRTRNTIVPETSAELPAYTIYAAKFSSFTPM